MSDSGPGGLLGRLRSKRATDEFAHVDEVTGLPDRSQLAPLAAGALRRAKMTSTRCAIAFVNVGELREINDAHGPAAGDDLLRAVASRLSTIDLPGTQVIRYQGSEFALVLERLPNPEAADEVCSFLIELMRDPFSTTSGTITVPCHVGLALSSDHYGDAGDLVRDAHEALVRARQSGPNASYVHDESKRMLHSVRIDEARLRSAIDDGEFVLHYQPIVRVDTLQLIGVEALIRWQMPGATNIGILYPHEFMPTVERTGLAAQLGSWIVAEACRQASTWQNMYPDHRQLFVACNIGAHQLASAGFADTVRAAIDGATPEGQHPLQPWQLILDITEDALHYNRNASWTALRELKALGVKIGLDDFGTGVSSLLYLRQLSLDLVRIDKVFIDGLEHNAEDRAIVKHVAALAHELELIVIAEGVESEVQVPLLEKLGVDLAQGFHFGRPETAAQIAERIRPDDVEPERPWDPANVYEFGS